jgi:hypothetical protein
MEQSNYRRRTYTPEEDAIIINCVKESPDNISRALRQASQSIGRTYKTESNSKTIIKMEKNTKYHI